MKYKAIISSYEGNGRWGDCEEKSFEAKYDKAAWKKLAKMLGFDFDKMDPEEDGTLEDFIDNFEDINGDGMDFVARFENEDTGEVFFEDKETMEEFDESVLAEAECACGDVSCTSAECQAMAPAKVISPAFYSGNKKKALGKKDKYNKLGENRRPLKEWRASSAEEAIGWIDSELNTLEYNVDLLIQSMENLYPDDPEVEGMVSAIRSSLSFIRTDCIDYKK